MVEYGSWAGGAFAIGVGVVPAIALLAVLAVPRGERERPGVRALVIVTAGAVVSFGWYAAIKGAYLSTTFSSLIVERNLVYLAPLAFVATAYLLSRGTAPVWAVLVGGRGGARADPVGADRPRARQLPVLRGARPLDPRAREPRMGLAARPDRERARRAGAARDALLLLVGTPLRRRVPSLAARPRSPWRRGCSCGTSRRRSTRRSGSTTSARWSSGTSQAERLGRRRCGRGSVVLLGQRMNDDPLGVPSTEFWNRSIARSGASTAPGPGRAALTPDLEDVDGTLWPSPETDYVLASGGVEVVGPVVAQNAGSALVRLDGEPIRLRSNQTGIAADGWALGDPGDPSVPARRPTTASTSPRAARAPPS